MATTRHIWPMSNITFAATVAGTAISASTTFLGNIFTASKTGFIDRVVVRVTNVSAPPVYDMRIESLNSSGNPSGTLFATGTNVTWTPTASTTHTLTLSSPASVTRGQRYAVVVRYSSGTLGSATFAHSNVQSFMSNHGGLDVVSSSDSGSAWTRSADVLPAMCPLYSDNQAEIGGIGAIFTATHFLSTTGVTDIGARFTAPMSGDCVGAIVYSSTAIASGNIPTLNLFNMGNTSLASQSLAVNPIAGLQFVYFPTPVSIVDGTEYRLAITAATSTTIQIQRQNMMSADANKALHGDSCYTSRTAGVWTDILADAPILVPLLASPVSSGGGGGSLAFNPVVRLP